jgi:hypothetical protein
LLLLGEDLSLAGITPTAEGWLAEVAKSDWPSSSGLPGAVYSVAARLLALERGGDYAPPGVMPRTRLRTSSGRWLVLHASRLRAADAEGLIAVIFEEARPSEIAPLIVDAYGLTKREGEITRLVLRGLSTAEVSNELYITPNTVHDHLQVHLRQGRRAQPQRARGANLHPTILNAHGGQPRTRRRRLVHLSRCYKRTSTERQSEPLPCRSATLPCLLGVKGEA